MALENPNVSRPLGRPVLKMNWNRLLFAHWRIPPAEIQKTLPRGLEVDVFDGSAWLAIVPFFMERVHPVGLPPMPWLSWFQEMNVRTYVRDVKGNPGVWFYSLVCNQPIAVEGARRLFHLNYVHARMHAYVNVSGTVDYFSRRDEAVTRFRYTPAGPRAIAAAGTLEHFLVERYTLFSADRQGNLYSGKVFHRPYEVGPADLDAWSFVPAQEDGFHETKREPDHVLMASALEVDAWPLEAAGLKVD
jgi:uncharacterized protein YqjF (DUF2071 family)